MKKLISVLWLAVILSACSVQPHLAVQLHDGAVPLLENSRITPEDFKVELKKGFKTQEINDFTINQKIARNIDSVEITYGDQVLAVPVTLWPAQGYTAVADIPLYDSTVIEPDAVTLNVAFCDEFKKQIPLSQCENIKISDNETDFNISFDDCFGAHKVSLKKEEITQLMCADIICPAEPVSSQELNVYALYKDGHTGPLKKEHINIHTATALQPGKGKIKIACCGQEYIVDVNVAEEEIHPLKMEIASGKRTLPTSIKDVSGVCFIGDSRLCGMESSVNSDAFFIHRTAANLHWLEDEAMTRYSQISRYAHTIIIVMGLNDLYHPGAYAQFINQLAEDLTNERIIFISLGPVDEVLESQHGYSVKNSEIEEFNQKIKANLNEKAEYIDIYTYMLQEGFDSTDGVHYKRDDYIKLYNYIMEQI